MKSLILTSCFALALTLNATAADIPSGTTSSAVQTSLSPSSFAGKWVLDAKKSPNVANAPAHLIQEIKPDGEKLVVKSRYDQPQNGMYPIFWVGIMTDELELGTDGNETVNNIGPFDHRSKTVADGNTLKTEWKAMNGQVEGEWVRKLSDDGKHMTMEVNGKCVDGRQMTATLYFTKK
jgi:hypothetical protein